MATLIQRTSDTERGSRSTGSLRAGSHTILSRRIGVRPEEPITPSIGKVTQLKDQVDLVNRGRKVLTTTQLQALYDSAPRNGLGRLRRKDVVNSTFQQKCADCEKEEEEQIAQTSVRGGAEQLPASGTKKYTGAGMEEETTEDGVLQSKAKGMGLSGSDFEESLNQRVDVVVQRRRKKALERRALGLQSVVQRGKRRGRGYQPTKFERGKSKWLRRQQEEAARHKERTLRNPRPPKSRGGTGGLSGGGQGTLLFLLTLMMIAAAAADTSVGNQEKPKTGGGYGGGGRFGNSTNTTGGALVPYFGNTTAITTPWNAAPLSPSFFGMVGNLTSLLPVVEDRSRALTLYQENERDQLGRKRFESDTSKYYDKRRSAKRGSNRKPSSDSSKRSPFILGGKGYTSRQQVAKLVAEKTGLLVDQVQPVVNRFFSGGGEVAQELSSTEGFVNYVKRVLGVRFEGDVEYPAVSEDTSSTTLRSEIDRRLRSPVWAKLDKTKILGKYKGQMGQLLQSMIEIEAHAERGGLFSKERAVMEPMRWIEDYMKGRPFETTPTLDSEGRLNWGEELAKQPQEQPMAGIQTAVPDSEVGAILARIQAEIPHQDARDGCFARADFSAYYMQVLKGLKGVGKIRIEMKSGKPELTPSGEVFKEAAVGQQWGMHTAATLTTEEGTTYVMDPALREPLPEAEWIKALNVDGLDGVKISTTNNWNYDLQEDKEGGVSLLDTLSQMRGLYLSEVVGPEEEGQYRPWTKWEHVSPHFAPVETKVEPKAYLLTADSARPTSGIFRGESVSESEDVDANSFYKLEFPEKGLTLMVPKEFTGSRIKSTGIPSLPVSRREIDEKLKEARAAEET